MRQPVVFLLLLLAAHGCKWGNDLKIPPPSSARLPTAQDQPSYDAMNGVAFKLAAQMAPAEGSNMLFSPVGAGQDLLMLMAGTSNTAHDELMALVKANEDNKQDYYDGQRALLNRLDSIPNRPYKLGSALFTVWPVLDKRYVEKMGAAFGSPVLKLGAAGVESTRLVNEWASRATDGRVPNIIASLDREKPLLLMSIAYLESDWAANWSSSPGTFSSPTGAINTTFCSTEGESERFKTEWADAVKVPFAGRELSLIVVLPEKREAPASAFANIGRMGWESFLHSFKGQRAQVSLPSLDLDTTETLDRSIASVGCPSLFETDCDLRPMSIEMERGFQVSEVLQRAVFKSVAPKSGSGAETASAVGSFVADRPFAFFVVDKRTGVILMMGVVNDPTKP